jgi:ADP-heptose:LPS heptosyltransferase
MIILHAKHGFGDNLMVTAVLEGIKQDYPDLKIFILARHPEIFLNNPRIDYCWDDRKIPPGHPVLKQAFILEYIDYYEQRRKDGDRLHHIERLYEGLPIPVTSRCLTPRLYLTEEEKNYRAADLAGLKRPIVAVSPYGKKSSSIVSKIYPADKWETIIKQLLEKGITLLHVGATSEGPLLDGCLDWRDLGYRLTASVFSRCNALVTHPGGIMHLAAACGTPCVAIFGGIENPMTSGYPGHRILTVPLDCAPCWRKQVCRNPKCWDLLPPRRIVEEIIDLLNTQGCSL